MRNISVLPTGCIRAGAGQGLSALVDTMVVKSNSWTISTECSPILIPQKVALPGLLASILLSIRILPNLFVPLGAASLTGDTGHFKEHARGDSEGSFHRSTDRCTAGVPAHVPPLSSCGVESDWWFKILECHQILPPRQPADASLEHGARLGRVYHLLRWKNLRRVPYPHPFRS
jgi:hypothetical protein